MFDDEVGAVLERHVAGDGAALAEAKGRQREAHATQLRAVLLRRQGAALVQEPELALGRAREVRAQGEDLLLEGLLRPAALARVVAGLLEGGLEHHRLGPPVLDLPLLRVLVLDGERVDLRVRLARGDEDVLLPHLALDLLLGGEVARLHVLPPPQRLGALARDAEVLVEVVESLRTLSIQSLLEVRGLLLGDRPLAPLLGALLQDLLHLVLHDPHALHLTRKRVRSWPTFLERS